MTIDELKQTIEQRTGVPASLLTGETAEENIAQAKALLAYRREQEAQRPKSTAEQFAEWAGGEEPQDDAGAALADLEEAARVAAGGYPRIQDGGEIPGAQEAGRRSTAEQFAEWYRKQNAFNPFEDETGWIRLC